MKTIHPLAQLSAPGCRTLTILAAGLFTVLVVAGCASTKVTDQHPLVTGPLPRPTQIWVCDFAASPAEVPADSALACEVYIDPTPPTSEELYKGRALGAQIAAQLVEEIHAMGLPAEQATQQPILRVNDLMFKGYLLSINEGSAAKRVGIGFGSGGSELRTAVEGFQMTANGLRKLGYGTVDAGSSKGPGAAVGGAVFLATANPVGLIVSGGMKVYGEASGSSKVEGRAKATAKEIAEVLKNRFQDQGWIK